MTALSGEATARFIEKIDVPVGDGCWEWAAGRRSGYGYFDSGGKRFGAHRVSYEYFNGATIPAGMQIDHICRTRGCVRPDHLRVVTLKTNVLENSVGVTAKNLVKEFCSGGHEYSPSNTYQRPGGGRSCRECMAIATIKYRRANLVKLAARQRERKARIRLQQMELPMAKAK